MKWEGKDFIIHGLFVDDMQHTSTSQALMDEFMHAYSRDFEITGGEIMTTFLGLQVDHVNSEIHMHMDHYVETVLNEYKTFVMNKTLRHKRLPVQPNYQLPKTEPKLEGKREDPTSSKDDLLLIIRHEAPISGDLGEVQHLIHCEPAGQPRRQPRTSSLGSPTSSDGVPRSLPKLQAGVQEGVAYRPGTGCFRRL